MSGPKIPNGTSEATRDELATEYFSQLRHQPYPAQEQALLAWFTSRQGVLVCTPTGTGKTLIAEAALFEALRTNRIAYYTTPLIALTEQKFEEMRARAREWGFSADDVGLVTGNRRINPSAKVLIVVAEILLNRLLAKDAFDFGFVENVVMDEFHNFADVERGIVWELTLGLLPPHVRTLLLSATVGNAYEFTAWLRRAHQRDLELVQSEDRRVPLSYHWIPDQLLNEQLAEMAKGDDAARFTPALVFCFNRDECWDVADQMRGKQLIDAGRQSLLDYELRKWDLSEGAGPKLRTILLRGIGVHHAGLLPKYRRIVEELFEQKLLSYVVCTETLAAGINLPARSVILPGLVKGPPDKKRLIDASSAHQMFGRAGRPQYDSQGHVVALAHEDDVKILRWRERFDKIPDDTRDPHLRNAKKAMAKKMPKRRANEQYWSESQFRSLIAAPPSRLWSQGKLPWRLLAHIVERTSDLTAVRDVVAKRLMNPGQLEAGQRHLDQMLLTLWRAGYVRLEPTPPFGTGQESPPGSPSVADSPAANVKVEPPQLLFGQSLVEPRGTTSGKRTSGDRAPSGLGRGQQAGNVPPGKGPAPDADEPSASARYRAERAWATDSLPKLNLFRGVNPLYGVFLANQLGIADREERVQALESVLEIPGSILRFVRVPSLEELPPGALAQNRLDEQLLRSGLVTAEELTGSDPNDRSLRPEERVWPLTFADKLKRLFEFDYPGVDDVTTRPVWAAGEILRFGGSFNKFILHRRLQRQEGLIFRHLLRLILLITEFLQIQPPEGDPEEWKSDLRDLQQCLVATCTAVDSSSTEKALAEAALRESGE